MRRILFLLAFAAILVVGLCLARTDAASPSQAPPAPQQAGAPRGGGFGGPIELGPDDKPAFPDPPAGFNAKRDNVPHGEMTAVQYDSKTLGTRRQMRVYTPPGYSAAASTRCSICCTASAATTANGRRRATPDNVIDNLLADGKIQPMIVVFPNGNRARRGRRGGASPGRHGRARRSWRCAAGGGEPGPQRRGAGVADLAEDWRAGDAFRERLAERHHPLHRVPLLRIYGPRTSRSGRPLDGRRPDTEHRPGSRRDVCLGRRVLVGPEHQELRRTGARSGGSQEAEAAVARLAATRTA